MQCKEQEGWWVHQVDLPKISKLGPDVHSHNKVFMWGPWGNIDIYKENWRNIDIDNYISISSAISLAIGGAVMKLLWFFLREACLVTHNTHRAKHGVPALKLSSELNMVAQVTIMMMMMTELQNVKCFTQIKSFKPKYSQIYNMWHFATLDIYYVTFRNSGWWR